MKTGGWMQGKRKWLLAVLSLILGAALAFNGTLTQAFVDLILILNSVHGVSNGFEHYAAAKMKGTQG